MKPIILASSSPYRRNLLEKTGLKFECRSPHLDEAALTRDLLREASAPEKIAEKLSLLKAQTIYDQSADKEILVIGGDQLVSFDGHIIGKPHNFENAFQQLSQFNGKTHTLITAITLIDRFKTLNHVHTTQLQMKNLSPDEIRRYLEDEKPYDCAGSYKIESKGITLFSHIDCDDFSAIQGIPMIWLTNQLKERGYEFF